METAQVVTALLAKRQEIDNDIADLERQVRQHKADIAKLDATIRLFAPSVTLAKREATRFARSEHFEPGELTRRCNQALRESDGKPFYTGALVTTAMKEKDLDVGDAKLRADLNKRFMWTLNRMLQRGAVQKAGIGPDAKWSLPRADQDRLLAEMMK